MEAHRRLDPEGYIVPEADLANVQPEYRGLPEAAADLLVRELGPRLHSGYLYGSVVRGNAVPGRSDLDLVAVLWTPIEATDRLAASHVERGLVARFPVLPTAGVALTHLEEVRSSSQRHGMQVFLRDLSVCVCGEDLRPGLPRTRPSAAVAAAFNEDTPAVLARARETLRTRSDPEAVRRACRIASKRMVQAGFAGAGGRPPTRTPWRSCWTASAAGWRRRSGGCRRSRDQFESLARPLGCAAVPAT